MRKWLCYIEKGLEEGYEDGNVIIFSHPSTYSEKGTKRVMELMNIKTGKSREVAVVIGLGYADFENEADFKKRLKEVIERKLKEVGVNE
ncbi:MAG: hypothetical protein DRH24_16250 [Deltaproteobacteria bacterium]|nr:MAG: hypothetical protein DRH24_16250 [Deltaproteobacteria bacterium]